MDLEKIKDSLKNEPSFRLKQVYKALFFDLVENWNDITSLPQELREKINKDCPIDKIFENEQIFESKDKQTIKTLFTLTDESKIESVLMRHLSVRREDEDERQTVCVSSQVGCNIGCKFCATGQQGFKRNLTVSEILNQILFFARILKNDGKRITNIVFMGMGEPFLNYDNVLKSIKILNDKNGFNIGARHISISTAGIIEGIEKLSNEKLQINLAISLHAPNDKLRSELMPINEIYTLEKILKAVDDYILKTKRRVIFEYLLIDKIKD
jgi:23S rRNA (adenine2503-C2)-methyltransferase